MTQFFGGGETQQKGKVQTFWFVVRPSSWIPSFGGRSWSPHKENLEDGAWFAYYNDFEKSEWEHFLSKQQIHSM